MQSINIVIVRPVFLLFFFGTGVLIVAAMILGWQDLGVGARALGVIGGAVYILGCLGVTVAFNVPLNNKLALVNPEGEEGEKMWEIYLSQWVRWNHVRSLATLLSTTLLIMAVYYSN